MQLSQSLNLKQKQSLVMTPQLQQAIKLLQLTNLELKQFLEEQTFDNPFIDVEEVVGMIIYLLSPVAKKITGQMLVIDGHTETLSMMEKD